MSESKDNKNDTGKKKSKTLTLGGTLSLKGKSSITPPSSPGASTIVEVRRKRTHRVATPQKRADTNTDKNLTSRERDARIRAVEEAKKEALRKAEEAKKEALRKAAEPQHTENTEDSSTKEPEPVKDIRQLEIEEMERIEAEERKKIQETQEGH